MRVYRSFDDLSPVPRSVVIGNLDGVHIGHQALIRSAQQYPERVSVLTFEPHPKDFFTRTASRLMRLNEKLRMLRSLGVDEVIVAHFNHSFAQQNGVEFATHVLRQKLNAQRVVVGADFRFGHRQSGNSATIREAGIEVVSVMPIELDGKPVSSTRVRDHLQAGQVPDAQRLLGHAYVVRGRVFQGQQLGRTLGFPTANLPWFGSRLKLSGIFAVRVHGVAEHRAWPGVASLGHRPTVDGRGVWLEVHLFDYSGDLYGRTLSVELCSKLRDELKFDSLEALVAQMHADAAEARAWLAQRS